MLDQLMIPDLTASEREELAHAAASLRADGWADFITVERLLTEWIELSRTVDTYLMIVDDYTNDVTSRDGLELAVAKCSPTLRAKLVACIEPADQTFKSRTKLDTEGVLAYFFRIDDLPGWWWRRVPETGPLAEALKSANRVR
ncbi:hypothetical protein C5708_01765 [Caulobacter sp. CCUG 60055]|uniref:hypothetical protein n=1 Tax=Caulobacter sp. CCUG 60055 TaxID=2100090 RepID=UPI001FA6D4AD|nr:hypothetical protein [Caulobacter sp. CCUG 60055]MBQ1540732.1 hypothetical protein [Caulobacteraceae bacterium]MCI3178974.1 hypothetical protein [Caulobacter sp. CCUG 60055]